MSDLIERLRIWDSSNHLMLEAVEEIERLREELTTLRQKLENDALLIEYNALRQKIDSLEPVAWRGVTGDYGHVFLSFQEQPGMTPLYSLEGIK